MIGGPDAEDIARNTGHDATQDDQRKAVADPLLGDQLAQPDGKHCPRRHRDQDGYRGKPLPGPEAETSDDARHRGHHQANLPEGLQRSQGHGEVERPLIQLALALFTLLLEHIFQLGEDRDEELQDDGGRNVGIDTGGQNGEVRHCAARQQVDQAEQLAGRSALRQEIRQLVAIHTRHGDVGGHTEDDEEPQGVEQPPPQVGQFHRIAQGINHCLASLPMGLTCPVAAATPRQELDRAARRLDLLASGGRYTVRLHGQREGQFAAPEDDDQVLAVLDKPTRCHRLR